MNGARHLACILLLIFAAAWGSLQDDAIDEQVERILGQMSEEDDAYGIEPESTLKKLKTGEEIEEFVKMSSEDMPVVLGYFDLATTSDEFDIFETLGQRDGEHYHYAYVTNKTVLEDKGYDGSAVFVYMSSKYFNPADDKPKARYPNKTIADIVHLKTFIRRNAVPLVGEMTPANEKLYRNTRLPVVTVFTHLDQKETNPKGYAYVLSRVRRVALDWRDQINFNLANIKEYRRDMDQKYDLEDAYSRKPVMVGLRDRGVYYPMAGNFSGARLQEFVQDFVAGRLEGNEQFDDYLNKDDDDPVTDVVTFAQAVETANLAKRDKEQGKSQPEAAAGSNSGRGSDVGAETVAESAVQIEGGTTTGAKASSDDGQPSTTDAAAANADTAPATMNSQTTSGTADTEPDSEEKTSAKDKKDKQKANPKQRKAKNKKEVDNEVVTLSSLNVKEILRPSNRRADVFLLFHRKGCPLCRTLKDEFRRTANAFKDDGGMIVAALDTDVMPIPAGFTVESYPSIFFVPASAKKRTELYTGQRQTGDMIQYLFKHRTTPVGFASDLFRSLHQDQKRRNQKADSDKGEGTGKKSAKETKTKSQPRRSEDEDEEDDDEL